jgi:hypothetical protein
MPEFIIRARKIVENMRSSPLPEHIQDTQDSSQGQGERHLTGELSLADEENRRGLVRFVELLFAFFGGRKCQKDQLDPACPVGYRHGFERHLDRCIRIFESQIGAFGAGILTIRSLAPLAVCAIAMQC